MGDDRELCGGERAHVDDGTLATSVFKAVAGLIVGLLCAGIAWYGLTGADPVTSHGLLKYVAAVAAVALVPLSLVTLALAAVAAVAERIAGGDPSIGSVSISSGGNNVFTATSDEFKQIAGVSVPDEEHVEDDDRNVYRSSGVILYPKKGPYDGDSCGYWFRNGTDKGAQTFMNVRIDDDAFLAKIASGEVRLSDKDVLKVDMTTVQHVRRGGTKPEYTIDRVVEYTPYAPGEQLMLDMA